MHFWMRHKNSTFQNKKPFILFRKLLIFLAGKNLETLFHDRFFSFMHRNVRSSRFLKKAVSSDKFPWAIFQIFQKNWFFIQESEQIWKNLLSHPIVTF